MIVEGLPLWPKPFPSRHRDKSALHPALQKIRASNFKKGILDFWLLAPTLGFFFNNETYS
jgi:hypothetical protein